MNTLPDFLERMTEGVAFFKLQQQDNPPGAVRYLYTNPAFHQSTGFCPVPGWSGTDAALKIDDSEDGLIEACRQVAASGAPARVEASVGPLGQRFSIRLFGLDPEHILGIFDRAANTGLHDTAPAWIEHQFRYLVDGAPEAIFIQTGNRFAYLNAAALRLFGASRQEQLLGTRVFDRIHPDHHEVVMERIRRTNDEQVNTAPIEETYLRLDGSSVPVSVSAVPMRFGGEQGALVFVRDITAQKLHEEYLKEVAYRDPLTKLPNGTQLGERLREEVAANQRNGSLLALCYLDLDGFKEINDRLGGPATDRLLVALARRLQGAVDPRDTVARVGHDEFMLLLSARDREEECGVTLDRIAQAFTQPFVFEGHPATYLAASIGVTFSPKDPADVATLQRHAYQAMYAAKQAGKNRLHYFDSHSELRANARNSTLNIIESALENGEFVLHYQPQVDCRNGRVMGVEALIRWEHPTLGLQPPGTFLPVLEDHVLAVRIGTWVIHEAVRQIDEWQRLGIEVRISVNTFASQLSEPGFVHSLQAILAEFPAVSPARLQLEILETVAVKDLVAVQAVIETCRRFGVAFSLDDFGTGYSSLVYLRRLAVGEIKIDQSFVRDMLVDDEDQKIVDAVIRLGAAFSRSVVAEGVETTAHVSRLLSLGCNVMQGFALARPMPGHAVPEWLADFTPDPAWRVPNPVPAPEPSADDPGWQL